MIKKHVFNGRVLMVGFGCIAQGTLPILLQHIAIDPARIHVFDPNASLIGLARQWGLEHHTVVLTPENYRETLSPWMSPGDFLINLSVDVSSLALIALCQEKGVNYLDTCIEPWAGEYFNTNLPLTHRTNYMLRERALSLRRPHRDGPTIVLTHGANPGLVSHLTKEALLHMTEEVGYVVNTPQNKYDWAHLAQQLKVKVIHIAERDTQISSRRKLPGEFVNTWSVDAFIGEGLQPAELGWGSHEKHFPEDGCRHDQGCRAAIYLNRPGMSVNVRSWTPLAGPQLGYLITHGESITMADYLTLGEGDHPEYRPTVHYAYHPSEDTVLSLREMEGCAWLPQKKHRIIKEDIVSGLDELGVLLMGDHPKGIYWYGSRLDITTARQLAPLNNATSLQVTAPVVAAVVWAMKNPNRDVVDPEDLPHTEILDLCLPYLGEVVGVWGKWTPLHHRSRLFVEDVNVTDPWQFKNFRVA